MTPEQQTRFATFRAMLQSSDDLLLQVLRDRAVLVNDFWKWKAENGFPLIDSEREAVVKQRLLDRANELGLDATKVKAVLDAVIGQKLLR